MPSRKKAQGQARKAKQAAAARCIHLSQLRNDYSQDDRHAALNLYVEFNMCKNNDIDDEHEKVSKMIDIVDSIYDKYKQFNIHQKGLFRQMLFAEGTECCVDASTETDLTKESTIEGLSGHVTLILTIEVRDRHNEAFNQNIINEVQARLNDIMDCPRGIVKFFHRGNPCNCLHEIYYTLKDTTSRTALCWGCKAVVGIKEMSECSDCKVARYCSHKCAIADWPEHRKLCKLIREPKDTKSESMDNIETVD